MLRDSKGPPLPRAHQANRNPASPGGHGKASAKGDGAKASERERQETWDQLSELAVSKAI
jgi:hypothetical protein